jgi:cysteine desulfuration protein SufE
LTAASAAAKHIAMTLPALAEIEENLSLLDDWEERYRYLIELGRMLPPLSEDARIEENKVRGCASQVWLSTRKTGQGPSAQLHFDADSDAHIVKGLVALALALFSDRKASEIIAIDTNAVFDRFQLKEHLSSQRSNGFRSLIEKIRQEAAHA